MELIIPSRPELLMRVQKLLAEDPEPAQLAALIKKDVALYTILLSTVNSPLFRRAQLIESVEHAVAILGVPRVASMVQAIVVRTTLDPDGSWKRFWEVATEIATLCYRLAAELGSITPDTAYSLGMMHDVGMGVMRASFPEYEKAMEALQSCNAVVMLKTEKEQFGTDRYTAAGALAEQWFMPADLCNAVRWQAHAQAALMGRAEVPDPVKAANALLVLAKDISQEYDAYWSFNSKDALDVLVSRALDYFGIDRNQYLNMKEDMIYQLAADVG